MPDSARKPLPAPLSQRLPSRDFRFIDELLLDLTLRLEWLGQVLDSVPHDGRSADALASLRSYEKALGDLKVAIGHVQSHAKEPALASLFRLEGPLAAYLSRLYAWAEELASEFEALAVGLRREEPVWTVFSHRAVNGSFMHFEKLNEAVRKGVAGLAAGASQEGPQGFAAHLEEMIWATEWLHLSLAKRLGD